VPAYKEINPAIFTAVSFPFLFGVMFGDVGHGIILFALGLLLFVKHPAIKPLFKLRYLILLMGFFATYNGLIYNDFMSLPFYFSSCFKENPNPKTLQFELVSPECVHLFGVDPRWYQGSNLLTFLNSMKMKISVVIAIV